MRACIQGSNQHNKMSETEEQKPTALQQVVYIPVAALAVGGLFLLSNLFANLVYLLALKVFKIPMPYLAKYAWVAELVIASLLVAVFFGIYKLIFGREDKERSKHKLTDTAVLRAACAGGVKGLEQGRAGFSGKLTLISLIMGAGVSGISFVWVTLAAYIPYFKKSLNAMDAGNAEMAGGGLIYLFISAAVVAPLLEELVFRGLVYRPLNKVVPGWFAIIVSALVFGIYHMNVAQAVYTTVMAIAAAVLYAKTRNLLYPILLHFMNNFIGVIQSVIPEEAIIFIDVATVLMIAPTLLILYKWIKGRKEESGEKEVAAEIH